MASVRENLEAFLEGRLPGAQLEIVYSDMHGFHGGLDLAITGEGKVIQTAIRSTVYPPRRVDAEDLRAIVRLLLDLEAWEQRESPRPPVPDESTVRLSIEVGGVESSIWEWFNDLRKTNRLERIRGAMTAAAWDKGQPSLGAWPPPR